MDNTNEQGASKPADPHPNGLRKNTKILTAIGGGAGGLGIGAAMMLFNQLAEPIKNDIVEIRSNQKSNYARLESKIDLTGSNTIIEIRQLRSENERSFDRLLLVIKEERAAQYRIDSSQDERIRELAERAKSFSSSKN